MTSLILQMEAVVIEVSTVHALRLRANSLQQVIAVYMILKSQDFNRDFI